MGGDGHGHLLQSLAITMYVTFAIDVAQCNYQQGQAEEKPPEHAYWNGMIKVTPCRCLVIRRVATRDNHAATVTTRICIIDPECA